MRLLTYNILDGGVGRADPIGEVIEAQHADVVVLIEADDAEVVERIASRLAMDVIHAPGHGHTIAILSRQPILQTTNHALRLSDGPRSFIETIIQTSGGAELPILAIHASAGAYDADERQRLNQLKLVLETAAAYRKGNRPHVIVGDFNSNAPTQQIDIVCCKTKTQEAYAANGNKIPREAIAQMLAAGYIDTLHACTPQIAETTATFTTHEPGQRVDYIFTFGIERARLKSAWIEQDRLATYASDHYPTGVELDV